MLILNVKELEFKREKQSYRDGDVAPKEMCLRFSLCRVKEAKIKYSKVLRLMWFCLAIAGRGGGRAARGRRAFQAVHLSSSHTAVCQEPWQ